MRGRAVGVLLGLLLLAAAVVPVSAQTFPELTGRVVDQAGILDARVEQEMTDKLTAHEQASSNQVVVATVGTLEGFTIEDYGYRLGRHWGIGQSDRDNGVLLIVAPNERKVRIEVGYGLEGDLPDALAHRIIQDEILPAFRAGQMEQGVVRGGNAILAAINGAYVGKPEASSDGNDVDEVIRILFIMFWCACFFGILILNIRRGLRGEGGFHPGTGGGHRGGFSSSGGFSGGGFSGGGGGFGGGGGSGSW